MSTVASKAGGISSRLRGTRVCEAANVTSQAGSLDHSTCNGAANGTTGGCQGAKTQTCTPQRTRPQRGNTVIFRESDGAGVGRMRSGPAGRPFDYALSPSDDATTLAFES